MVQLSANHAARERVAFCGTLYLQMATHSVAPIPSCLALALRRHVSEENNNYVCASSLFSDHG